MNSRICQNLLRSVARKMGLAWFVFLVPFFLPTTLLEACVARSWNDDLETKIGSAIHGYQEALAIDDPAGRLAAFRKVEIVFSSLLGDVAATESGFSADLYVSWGNAAIQINDPGTAVLAFRKALVLEPSHSQARRNLEYIRSQLPAWTQSEDLSGRTWNQLFFWNLWLTTNTVKLISALAFALGCLCLACSIYSRNHLLRYVCVMPFLVWLVLLISLLLRIGDDAIRHVVFIAEETQCHTADSENSPMSFDATIPAGSEAKLLDQRAEWSMVEFGDRKQGWIPGSAIRLIE